MTEHGATCECLKCIAEQMDRDIAGGDIEIMGRLMSAERLAVKRAHAARHPEGRTAELIAHIEAQAQTIREARENIRRLMELALSEYGESNETWRARKWLAAHKEE